MDGDFVDKGIFFVFFFVFVFVFVLELVDCI